MVSRLTTIATDVDKICVVETLLNFTQYFIVLQEIIVIVRCKDHLLILEQFFIEILSFFTEYQYPTQSRQVSIISIDPLLKINLFLLVRLNVSSRYKWP